MFVKLHLLIYIYNKTFNYSLEYFVKLQFYEKPN